MKKILTLIVLLEFTFVTYSQMPVNSAFQNTYDSYKKGMVLKNRPAKSVALMNKYDVKFYWLDINLERTSTYISGKVTINAKIQNTVLDTFELELVSELTVDSAKINGSLCTVNHTTDFVDIIPSSALPANSDISAQIFYHGAPPSGGFFSGISHGTSQ